MSALGFEIIKPDGAFYILLKSQLVLIKIPSLSYRILRVKKAVAFIPGAFGQYGERLCAFVVCSQHGVIKGSLKRLKGVWKNMLSQ